MRQIILLFGFIIGGISTAIMAYSVYLCYQDPEFKSSELLGFSVIIVAHSLIFMAVKQFRDKHNNGTISFGTAFKLGVQISLVASTLYVVTWLIEYYVFYPDFMELFSAQTLKELESAGATADELRLKTEEMTTIKQYYKNPFFVVLMTYMEVFPVGFVLSLLSAFVLKRSTSK